ncbi:hypothetical protein [Mucilaginibacter psychrotolerans]|uniref:Prolyl-tRNA synthetase n=1 Tax=Mucilaginibacter psychrotolerans TaxID=1524096 RepID=A0A4Y8S4B1_9SPHI|nr:hypothetical protein [Mucilaginibacter psychrotolerans]TFF33773.1 hypothetical protein E2R66_24575 [Mucilaginibacter psychrotolerans]
MKRNLLLGIAIIGAVALSSCSVNKTASTAKNSDDVYFSQATAGEAPEYIAPKPVYQQQQDDVAYDGDNGDDDYYYYDDYSSRINRFGYYSPFSYYDSYYGNYNPYNYSNYGFSVGLNWSPFTLPYGSPYGFYGGIGYGYGAFSPYAGFGNYYGYGGGFGYSPYSYWGTGYGYGGNYWGVISANSTYGTPRPNRGAGSPRGIGVGGRNGVGYSGVANNGIGYYPNRPTRGSDGSYTTRPAARGYSNNGSYSNTRPTRDARGGNDSYQPQQRPASSARTPDRQPSYSPPSPSPSSGGGGGGGSSSGGGGGGGRPARP